MVDGVGQRVGVITKTWCTHFTPDYITTLCVMECIGLLLYG